MILFCKNCAIIFYLYSKLFFCRDGNGFWVGKKSLKDWHKRALTVFEEKEGSGMREVEDCPSPSSDIEAVPQQKTRSCSESDTVSINSNSDKTGNPSQPLKKQCRVSGSCRVSDQNVLSKIEVHSIFESLEKLLSETKENLKKLNDLPPDLVSEFKKKILSSWKDVNLMFNRICDYNSICSPSVSESTSSLVTSSTSGTLMENSTTEPSRINGICHSVEDEPIVKKRKFEQLNDKDGVNSGDENKTNKSDDEEDDVENFNEDIICQHSKFFFYISLIFF